MSCTKRLFRSFVPVVVVAALVSFIPNIVRAGITFTGDYGPSDTSTWDADTDAYIGTLDSGTMTTGVGTVLVDSGSTLTSGYTYLGYLAGSSGTGTVNSASQWTPRRLYVGYSGTGTLVTNGGSLTIGAEEYIPWLGVYQFNPGMAIVGGQAGSFGTLELNGGYCVSRSFSVGERGEGLMEVLSGAAVDADTVVAGLFDGASGTITVDGASTLDAAYDEGTGYLTIGGCSANSGGSGTLNITNGGYVLAAQTTIDSFGALHFGTSGNLDARSLYLAETAVMSGTGSIYTQGLVSDLDLTFDSSTGNYAALSIGDVSLTVDLSDTTGSVASVLGAGFRGDGTLLIRDGVHLYSMEGYVGYPEDASGTATVDGATWTLAQGLYVGGGDTGTALLDISNGGLVANNTNGWGCNYTIGNQGTIKVDATSQLICNAGDVDGMLEIGGYNWAGPSTDAALLQIDGGSVSATTTYVRAMGSVSFGTGGGTLNTQTLQLESTNFSGTGTVLAKGLYSDFNLSFDATHPAHQTIMLNGTVTLDLDLSNPATAGDLGIAGSMTIKDGVTVYSDWGYVGYADASSGAVTVDGGVWSCGGEISVASGWEATGTLQVSNGGTISATGMAGGWGGTSTAYFDNGTLRAADSNWRLLRGFTNTYIGAGGMTVDTNGYDSTIDQVLEDDPISTGGGLTKIGAGSLTLRSASTYTGATNINAGAVVLYGDNVLPTGTTVNLADEATASLNVNDKYQTIGGLSGGGATGGNVALGSGVLTVNAATNCTYAGVIDGKGEIVKTGSGTLALTGTNTYDGVTTVNGGVLELGTAAQAVVLTGGGADIQSGKMVFDYTGTAPDVGTLLTASYGPGDDDAWTTGQFLSKTKDASHGLGWVDDGVDEVTVMYTLYGDSNCDGSVNGTDLNAVLSYYNQSGQIWGHGDFNYDGSVNGTDLNTVLSNYNQSLPASTSAVPEPSTLLLMAIGLLGLVAWKKRFTI